MITIGLYSDKVKLNFDSKDWYFRAEIKQFLSFLNPRRFFVPSFKSGDWDGTISMLDRYSQTMVGFTQPIIEFIEEEGLDYRVVDYRENSFEFTDFVDVPEERQYQMDVVKTIADNKVGNIPFYRGIVKAATNSGKSYIMSYLIRSCNAKRILFLVSSKAVPKQMIELFSTHDEVGDFTQQKRITVATPKKMLNAMQKSKQLQLDAVNYDLVIVDESHKAGSPTYDKLLKYLRPYASLFFSATALDMDDQGTKLKIIGNSGKVLCNIKNKDVVDKGLSLALKVRFVDVAGVNCSSYTHAYHMNIINNDVMHELIYEECVGTSKICLIIVQYYEHAQNIQNYFKSKGFEVPLLSGEDFNQDIYDDFKAGNIQWLIGTMALKEGANLPKVQKQIQAFGGKGKIPVAQTLGRGQRVDSESQDTELEIVDFRFNVAYLKGHYAIRKKIYQELGATIVN